METSKQSTGETLFDLTLYAADTPANLSAPQASAEARMTHATYGLGLETRLANYDPDTQSWKMYGDTYLWGDSPLLESLPISGMTRNGELYQQPVWVPITDETESLSWPTPRNCTAMAATITPETANNPKRFPNLETVVGRRMWPTPTAVTRPMEGNVRMYRAMIEAGKMTEAEANAILGKPVTDPQGKLQRWPTPVASDAWTDGLKSSQQTKGSRHSLNLPSAAGGQLNPTWVEWLMGFPTGWTDLEDSETQ
jgi:hypothetical protein